MSNDPTNAERQARHRAKQRKARAALEAELRALRDERAAQAQAFRDGWKRRAAKPKAEKPPLPPDEARGRRIKALTTETRNLRAQVRYMREHSRDGAGNMNFATQGAIAKCLHPDQRHNATEADKDNAFKLFTAWKAEGEFPRLAGVRCPNSSWSHFIAGLDFIG